MPRELGNHPAHVNLTPISQTAHFPTRGRISFMGDIRMALEKLIIFSFLNLAALFFLLVRLMKQGNHLAAALQAAWRLVVAGPRNDHDISGTYPGWVGLLAKTWWLMNLFYLVGWLWQSEAPFAWAVTGIVLFHFVWYLAGHPNTEEYNRVIQVDRRFGVVFHEIAKVSDCCGKSLADLDLRKKDLLVLAVTRHGRMIAFPKGLEIIESGDRLLIFGDIGSFRTIFNPL